MTVVVEEGGWYRDGQDVLWIDAEATGGFNPPIFFLYRGGSGRRVYTSEGVFIREDGQENQTIHSWDLVVRVLREPQSEPTVTAPAEPTTGPVAETLKEGANNDHWVPS